MMTVRPSLVSSLMLSTTSSFSSTSRLEVGSSRKSTDGLVSSSTAMLTLFFWPPDNEAAWVSAAGSGCSFVVCMSFSSSITSCTRLCRSSGEVSPGNLSSAA
jgi:hypothetical protein